MINKYITYECLNGEIEHYISIEEARKDLIALVKEGDEDDCIPDDHKCRSGIFQMIETIKLTEADKKENYPCIKNSEETCDGGMNGYSFCEGCEEVGSGWPYSEDYDYVVDTSLEQVGSLSKLIEENKRLLSEKVEMEDRAAQIVLENDQLKKALRNACEYVSFTGCPNTFEMEIKGCEGSHCTNSRLQSVDCWIQYFKEWKNERT